MEELIIARHPNTPRFVKDFLRFDGNESNRDARLRRPERTGATMAAVVHGKLSDKAALAGSPVADYTDRMLPAYSRTT